MKIFKKRGKGFTLIELLVVIAIIGVMTAVVTTAFSTARKQGRVAKRVSDIKAIQAALEFYYASNHAYPTTGGVWSGVNYPAACGGGTDGRTTTGATAYIGGSSIPPFVPTYMPVLPIDPVASAPANCDGYLYKSDGTDYAFIEYKITEMEGTQSKPNYTSYPELVDPARGDGTNGSAGAWKVSTTGGVNW